MPVPDLVLEALGTASTADVCDWQAEQNGHGEAVVDSRARLTWLGLRERSDRLALSLLDMGAERNDIALVQLPNSVDLFITRLTCEKAGLVLAAVPVTFRAAELKAIIHHLRPAVAITAGTWQGQDYAALLRESAHDYSFKLVVRADEASNGPTLRELMDRRPQTSPDYLRRTRFSLFERAQIAATSGSTGMPRCAEVPMYARALTGWCQARRYGLERGDVLAAFTSIISGSAEVLAYHMAPRLGLRSVLVERFEAEPAWHVLGQEAVTGAIVVPTMLARLADVPVPPHPLPSLRFFVSYGAPLSPDLARTVEQRFGVRVVQAYGSSDYGGIAATSIDDPPETRWSTVGRPLEGTELRIVDESGQDAAPEVPGRLLVRGAHAVGGYYRNHRLSREQWSSGFFDLQEYGMWDSRGNLVLLGRSRDLIVRGGQNIFPADVEQALVRHPAIREAAVVGMPDRELGERLCAYVVLRDGYSLSLPSLVDFLRSQGLASFKLPERVEVLDQLPRVPADHKVDKARLREDIRQKLLAEGTPLESGR